MLKARETRVEERKEEKRSEKRDRILRAAEAIFFLSFIEESQIISRGPLSPKGSLVF